MTTPSSNPAGVSYMTNPGEPPIRQLGGNLNSVAESYWRLHRPFYDEPLVWSDLDVGNGTERCRYFALGGSRVIEIGLEFGSTTSVTGNPTVRCDDGYLELGGGSDLNLDRTCRVGYYDSSAGRWYVGSAHRHGAAPVFPWSLAHDGALLSSTVPFTWSSGDLISMQIVTQADMFVYMREDPS